jgi:hypothetical protein
VLVRTDSADFGRMLEDRYSGFITPQTAPACAFDVELAHREASPTGTMSRYASRRDSG